MDDELTQVETAVAGLVSRSVWSLHDEEIGSALSRIHTITSQLAEVSAALVRELDARAIPAAHGASATTTWLRDHLRISVHAAGQMITLSKLVDIRPALREALATGLANPEQVIVIGAAVTALTNDLDFAGVLDPAVIDKAEALLVDHAQQFEPKILRRLGERILAHVAPGIADEALRRRLERDEIRAYATRTFTLNPDGTGRSRLSGWLDTEAAAIVTAAIDPLCKPTPTAEGRDARTPGQRRADALVDVCRLALATTELPDNGGDRPHLTVTVGLDLMTRQLGVGTLDTGEHLSPAAIRRLACDAQIIPAALGSDGAVMDLGRTRRIYIGPIRRVLALRDGGCAFPGCDRPPRWCEGHHVTSWLDGGATNVDNGVLLCGRHHRVIHQGHWQVRHGVGGKPEFIPPAYVDPERAPRRNNYHLRP